MEALYYHPERELIGEQLMGVAPGWYGVRVNSFAEVAVHLANDSRFRQCAVENFSQVLLRRKAQFEDFPTTKKLVADFEANQLQVKSLILAITELPEYRDLQPAENLTMVRFSAGCRSRYSGSSVMAKIKDFT